MLRFKTPDLLDKAFILEAVGKTDYSGSDASFGNVFLLRYKYKTLVAFEDGFLFRYYNGSGSRRGYTFPLGQGDIAAALKKIEEDSQANNRPLEFCLVTDSQLDELRRHFGDRLNVSENRGDSDYIYSAESLATLNGKDFRKKRNHISRFTRTYSDFELQPLTVENRKDALQVEMLWLKDSDMPDCGCDKIDLKDNLCEEEICKEECKEYATAEFSEDQKSRCAEYDSIVEALENQEALGIRGAILYVQGMPVGMTMATEIREGVWDTHFEKVIGEYADNGGYAVINKLFAESLGGVGLINREEDINIEGLRKAKLSYYPLAILHKSHVTVNSYVI